MAMDKGKVQAAGIGLGMGTTLGLAIGFVLFVIHVTLIPGPPSPQPHPTTLTGEYVVVIVDDEKPTIAEGAIIDGPQLRALKAQGNCVVRSDKWKRIKDKHYDQLVTQAGGLPMIAILSKDGRCAHVGKLPMVESELQKLCAKYVTGLPPPSSETLTTCAPVDLGALSYTRADLNGQQYVDQGAVRRYLTAAVSPARIQSLPRYADSHPIFSEKEWRQIDRRPIFGSADWILDQGRHGSCVAQSGVGALRRVRWLAGMADVKLSPGYLYAQINKGQDRAHYVEDLIPALQNTGTCSFALVGQDPILMSQMPSAAKKEAARWKLGDAYRVQSWEELGSAIQTGRYIPVFAVQVGKTNGQPGNWTKFDQFGVAGHDYGPGNHALHADGMRKTGDGRMVLDVPNSWDYDWGPFKNGRVFLDKNHLWANGDQPSAIVFRVAADDPNDGNDPPAYRSN